MSNPYKIDVLGQVPDPMTGKGDWKTLTTFTSDPHITEQETLQRAREYAREARVTLRFVMLWREGHEVV